MTNPQNIDDLIARLREATGPDRVLDAEITVALDLRPEWTIGYGDLWIDHKSIGEPVIRVLTGGKKSRGCPPMGVYLALTRSVDAALTLVPSDAFWHLITDGAGNGFQADVVWKEHDGRGLVYVHGATPALALCIAALKAKQS